MLHITRSINWIAPNWKDETDSENLHHCLPCSLIDRNRWKMLFYLFRNEWLERSHTQRESHIDRRFVSTCKSGNPPPSHPVKQKNVVLWIYYIGRKHAHGCVKYIRLKRFNEEFRLVYRFEYIAMINEDTKN